MTARSSFCLCIPTGGCFWGAGSWEARQSLVAVSGDWLCLRFPRVGCSGLGSLGVGILLGTTTWMPQAWMCPIPWGHLWGCQASLKLSIPEEMGIPGTWHPRGEGTARPSDLGAPRARCHHPSWLVRHGRAGGALAGPAPRAALSCFANPAWHLPQLPAASREQGTN